MQNIPRINLTFFSSILSNFKIVIDNTCMDDVLSTFARRKLFSHVRAVNFVIILKQLMISKYEHSYTDVVGQKLCRDNGRAENNANDNRAPCSV